MENLSSKLDAAYKGRADFARMTNTTNLREPLTSIHPAYPLSRNITLDVAYASE